MIAANGKRLLRVLFLSSVALLVTACEQTDPQAGLRANHLPSPDFIANPALGEVQYKQYCTACHGELARGSDSGPPLIDRIYQPAHHADLAFHWAVAKGVRQHHWRYGDMPPLPDVQPEEVGNIISYLRLEQQRVGIR